MVMGLATVRISTSLLPELPSLVGVELDDDPDGRLATAHARFSRFVMNF
jgi:hypothetical protein